MKVMINGKQFTQGATYQFGEKRTPVEKIGHENPAVNEIHANPNLTREEKISLARKILNSTNEEVKPAGVVQTVTETKRNKISKIRRSVVTLANKINSKLKNLSASFKKAWQIIKAGVIKSKIAGASFHQKALQHLTRYNPQSVKTELVREASNLYVTRKSVQRVDII